MIKIPYKTDKEWLELRRSGIGGSDTGAILELHNYQSPTGLWLNKLNRTAEQEVTEAMANGNLWEGIIRDRYIKESGNQVNTLDGFIYQSEEYPFMLASLDGEGVDKDGKKFVFEAKNTLSFDTIRLLEDGGTPLYWITQVLHYLIVTNYDYAVIAYQAGNSHHGTRIIERDPENEAKILEAEKEFWSYVENNTPPELDGSPEMHKYLFDQYNKVEEESIDLTLIGDRLEKQYQLGQTIKDLKQQREVLSAEIKKALGNNKCGSSARYKATWSRNVGKTFDVKRFKEENPDIVEKYQTDRITNTLTVREVKNGK
jgi:putative phage-type endonuclease